MGGRDVGRAENERMVSLRTVANLFPLSKVRVVCPEFIRLDPLLLVLLRCHFVPC